MFADETSGYSSGSVSGSMNSSFSSTSWDMSFTDSTKRDSYDSSYDAVKVEDPYGSMSQNSIPTTHNGLPDGASVFQMDGSNMIGDMLTYPSFPVYSAPGYDSFGNNPNHDLEIDTNISILSINSDVISSPGDFVIPSETTFLSAYDLNSPMRASDFDTSPISECPTDYSFDSPEDETQYMSSVGSVSSYGSVKSEANATRLRSVSFKQHVLGYPLQTSAALHRVQFDCTDRESQVRHKRPIKRETAMIPSLNFGVQRKAKKECPFPNCHKKFQRAEHLKRHERTHTNSEKHPCPFCNKSQFGRSDNLKSHIKLHTVNKKTSRTKYHPAAQEYFTKLCSQSLRKSASSRGVRVKSESSPKSSFRCRL